jgi:hypothetical protein
MLRLIPRDNPEHNAKRLFCLFRESTMVVTERRKKNIDDVWFISEAEVKMTLGESMKSIPERMAVLRSNVSLQRRKMSNTDSAARRGLTIHGLPSRSPTMSREANPGGY